MKIALVTPYDYPYPGGVTEHIRHLDREFRRRGHEVRILAPSSKPQEELPENVIRVSDSLTPVRFNGSTARLALSPAVAGEVVAILDRERFDVVHLHEPEVPLVSLAVLLHSTAVNVGTFHALLQPESPIFAAYPLLWPVLQGLDGRIFVSEPLRDAVTAYLPDPHRVIPNGIDFTRFASPDVQPIREFADGRPNVLFVGRMDERKGFRHLFHAYPQIKRAVPDARLLVVGAYQPEDVAEFERIAREQDVRDIHFIGSVSGEDLPRCYRTATVYSAPSTGSESFGIVLLEAMAAGAPIVASDIPGYRSVLTGGKEGLLASPGDEDALAAAVIRLLQDKQLRTEMAARGRVTAERYDWSVVAGQVLDYYAELLAERAKRPEQSFQSGLERLVREWESPKVDVKADWKLRFEDGAFRLDAETDLAISAPGGKDARLSLPAIRGLGRDLTPRPPSLQEGGVRSRFR